MTESLKRKIEYSIKLIRDAEKIALEYDVNGFHLAFSGGKDSMVLYHIAAMAGVKFHAEMQVTTVDPPELMKFVRKHYPDVKLNRPPINMYNLIRKKKMLPLRGVRYCCQVLKEQAGGGSATLLGIRKAESVRRSKRNEVETRGRKFSGNLDQFNNRRESQISCVKGKDKVLVSPILNWTDADVWNFIRSNSLPYCELYDMGFHRIGCMFCPMASKREKAKALKRYPKVAQKYKEAIQTLVDSGCYGQKYNMTADEIFDCWIKNENFSAVVEKRLQKEIEFKFY